MLDGVYLFSIVLKGSLQNSTGELFLSRKITERYEVYITFSVLNASKQQIQV